MRKFIEIIKKKWIRDSLLTATLVLILIAIFILVNLLFMNLDIAPWDFTEQGLYTLSDESKEQIANVEQNVTMYFFGYDEGSTAVTLAKQYHDANDKITIQIINTSERPDLAAQYNVSTSSQLVAVQATERYKIIDASEMYTYDSSTYQYIDVTEQKLTNAILDVTIAQKPQIYFLTGHGEYGISSSSAMGTLATYIENDVNDVNTLDLLTSDMPETCDVLVIANPTSDFTDLETEKIQNYINAGGKIVWMQDPYMFNAGWTESTTYPNITKILSQFGISFSSGVVCEQGTDHMIAGTPDLIVPEMTYNQIVQDLYTDGMVALLDSGRINTVSDEELEELGVTASPFLQSTETSFYRADINSNISQKLDSDEDGPFVLAEILTKKINDDTESTLVAYSNALFATNYTVQISGSIGTPISIRQNKDIILNTIAYLSDREDIIRIRKDTGLVSFDAITEQENRVVLWIIFAIPVIIIVAGIVVAIVRKRKK